jgi:hypothetical protein
MGDQLFLGGLLLVLFTWLIWLFLATVGELTLMTRLVALFLPTVGLIPLFLTSIRLIAEVLLRLVTLILLLVVHL